MTLEREREWKARVKERKRKMNNGRSKTEEDLACRGIEKAEIVNGLSN